MPLTARRVTCLMSALVACSVVDLAARSPGLADEQTLYVAPYKAPVTGVYPGLCLMASDQREDSDYQPLLTPIEGFEYEWGYRYRLSVESYVSEGLPTLTPSTRLRLIRVENQRTPDADYTFTIPLTIARVNPGDEGVFGICGEKQFVCGEDVDCAAFRRALESGARLDCTFRFAEDRGQPMLLVGWSPVGEALVAEGPLAPSGEIASDVPPVIRDGRTLVPLRAIFEWLGAAVDFDSAARRIDATRGDRSVRLEIGSETAWAGEQRVELDAPPSIIDGRTFVPLRFVSQAMGAQVDWDAEARTVTVTDGERVGSLRVP